MAGSGTGTGMGQGRFSGGPLGPPVQQPPMDGGLGPAFEGGPSPRFKPMPTGGSFGGGGGMNPMPPVQQKPPATSPMLGDPGFDGGPVQGLATPKMPPQMPAGMPTPQTRQAEAMAMSRIGGAPVNGQGPAKVGMSPAGDAQAQMMKRANVRPPPAFGGPPVQQKPAPVSAIPPKPLA